MKLKNLLESPKELNGNRVLVEMTLPPKDNLIGEKEIEPYLSQIKSCDEFKQCKLHLMKSPIETISGRTLTAHGRIVGEYTLFKGDCYLYQVSLSVPYIDPNTDTWEPQRGLVVRGVFNLNEF